MISHQNISTCICRTTISLALLLASVSASAQKIFAVQKDSIPFFNGLAVSFDLVGAGMMQFSDYGQYEGALRVNLHDRYFPILEVGYGKADHDDEVTGLQYKTSAPYFRLGCDWNLSKNKHDVNRLYGGFRYAFTTYDVDIARRQFPDPVWMWPTDFDERGISCNYHWLEAVFGIDAKIFGPLHLGWSVRYKRRIAHQDGDYGKTWYVPGFGKYGDTRLGGTFNVIIDI